MITDERKEIINRAVRIYIDQSELINEMPALTLIMNRSDYLERLQFTEEEVEYGLGL